MRSTENIRLRKDQILRNLLGNIKQTLHSVIEEQVGFLKKVFEEKMV